mmetsp:Transcript_91692/g.237627  ORF Transcript_91692/g.237627 Transcript_91692/m.237627 type:complete len:302 (+) Transcript_91692:2341-3246(+)
MGQLPVDVVLQLCSHSVLRILRHIGHIGTVEQLLREVALAAPWVLGDHWLRETELLANDVDAGFALPLLGSEPLNDIHQVLLAGLSNGLLCLRAPQHGHLLLEPLFQLIPESGLDLRRPVDGIGAIQKLTRKVLGVGWRMLHEDLVLHFEELRDRGEVPIVGVVNLRDHLEFFVGGGQASFLCDSALEFARLILDLVLEIGTEIRLDHVHFRSCVLPCQHSLGELFVVLRRTRLQKAEVGPSLRRDCRQVATTIVPDLGHPGDVCKQRLAVPNLCGRAPQECGLPLELSLEIIPEFVQSSC